MKLRKLAPLVFVLTSVVISAAPVLRANGDSAWAGVVQFGAECAVTSSATTCNINPIAGNTVGSATFTDTSFNIGSTFSTIDSQLACFLVEDDFVLTASDGSTLKFETSGTQCNDSDGSFRRQNSYLITGGTGHFAKVTGGGGNYVVSGLLPGFPATIHLDGNIQLPTQNQQ